MNCESEELAGWRLEVHRRKYGSTVGTTDFFYYAPDGRKFRSKNEIGKFIAGNKTTGPAAAKVGVLFLKDSPCVCMYACDAGFRKLMLFVVVL